MHFPPLPKLRTQPFPPIPNSLKQTKTLTTIFHFPPNSNQTLTQCVHGKSSPTPQTISTGKSTNTFPMLLPLPSPLPFPSLPWPIFFSKVPISQFNPKFTIFYLFLIIFFLRSFLRRLTSPSSLPRRRCSRYCYACSI